MKREIQYLYKARFKTNELVQCTKLCISTHQNFHCETKLEPLPLFSCLGFDLSLISPGLFAFDINIVVLAVVLVSTRGKPHNIFKSCPLFISRRVTSLCHWLIGTMEQSDSSLRGWGKQCTLIDCTTVWIVRNLTLGPSLFCGHVRSEYHKVPKKEAIEESAVENAHFQRNA